LLRLRRYGDEWTLTHKGRAFDAHHKTRTETETHVTDGRALDAILRYLGFVPMFRYEKFRSEWIDGDGTVVIDLTPIGNVAEIEGPPAWIDATAEKLGVDPAHYITKSYAAMFFEWKARTGNHAEHMTFERCGTLPPKFS
jgi:adenylate cyclase class 2